jgi:ubiquinone/menaquinone biosynthesis C-methylase UbiE
MKRVVIPELLDSDAGTPREISDSLADLRMINRFFGGARTMAGLLREIADRRRLKAISWLDVAGASGDIATLATEALAEKGIALKPVLLDRSAAHLNGKFPSVCGDALALPFRDNSFDVVGSSLFVHHLEPPEIAAFMRAALRVARHAVVINDLIRHPVHLALIYAGRAIYRSRLTRHDAVASVRRAYTVEEIRNILSQTGVAEIEIKRFFLFRMGVIAWKRPVTT